VLAHAVLLPRDLSGLLVKPVVQGGLLDDLPWLADALGGRGCRARVDGKIFGGEDGLAVEAIRRGERGCRGTGGSAVGECLLLLVCDKNEVAVLEADLADFEGSNVLDVLCVTTGGRVGEGDGAGVDAFGELGKELQGKSVSKVGVSTS
jgi:hypothetical protein